MSINKLQQLTKHLIDAQYNGRKLALPSQFDAHIEGGRIEPRSKNINGNGLIAASFYYSAVININPCAAPAELIAAYASFWMHEHSEKEDSSDIEFSCDINDDDTFDIELTIETFAENIELIEKANGPFSLSGKCYDFGEQSLWIAESFELNVQVKK